MNREALAASIDHTILGPDTTRADVERVVEEATEYGMNVCIPPCYVADVRSFAPDDLTIATVVGFPQGQHAPAAKASEARVAYADGADELDVVTNVGRLKAGELDAVREDLEAVVDATPLPVKVIIETPLLDDAEKHDACQAAVDAGADMVKTATGFSDGGATVPDVELMSDYLPVKASGGVGDYEDAQAMFDAGADRIGASSGVNIVETFEE
jgi:deoxyribose-phosphate aldolase